METSTHYCLSMIEAMPLHIFTDHEPFDYGFLIEDPEGGMVFGCDMITIGTSNGRNANGLQMSFEEVGYDETGAMPENYEFLYSKIREEYDRSLKEAEEHGRYPVKDRYSLFPIRIIVIWEFISTYYPDTWLGPAEWEYDIAPIDTWDLDSAMAQWAHEWNRKRLAEQQKEQANGTQ